MLDLVFQNLTSDPRYARGSGEASKALKQKFFEKILDTAIKHLKLGKKVEVSLSLVGEGAIKTLNKKYRQKNKVTDVLSFPVSDVALKKHGIIPLGDIFICLPFAKKEAKRENINIETKVARLTVHGFLHLAGYDHEKTSKDAKVMLKLEDGILRNIKF